MSAKKNQPQKKIIQFIATMMRFDEQGEKTGWTYIEIPADIAQQLKPGNKKTFRVKGKLDDYAINGIALLPMGGGNFIMPLNASMRKGTGKRKGAMLSVQLEADENFKIEPPPELLECLSDEPGALENFNKLLPSHRGYLIKWLREAKTEQTKIIRMAQCVTAMTRGMDFVQMIRWIKSDRDKLKQ